MLEFRELTETAEDLEYLKNFYETLFIAGFPDPDERESLENMRAYLQARAEGWYASEGPRNNYHILLAVDQGQPVAAAVCDYLAEPNVGIIEFLLVAADRRGQGLGRRFHDRIEIVLNEDARLAGHASLGGIVIEMNDPFRVDPATDNMDPFERAAMWGKWGYRVLGFPYTQPALSDDQSPVTCLLLCIKPLVPHWLHKVPATTVRQIVLGYLKWAMRISDPAADPTFQVMDRQLSSKTEVRTTTLAEYIGINPDRPFDVVPINDADSADYRALMQVYMSSFAPGQTVIDPACFGRSLARFKEGTGSLSYHLWGIRDPASGTLAGMTSFFSLVHVGFAGYIALTPPLQGTGRCRLLMARIETQMKRDRPQLKGWYIECDPGSAAAVAFEKLGFHRVPFRYLQPSLANIDPSVPAGPCGPELALMYKPLGQSVDRLEFSRETVTADLAEILSGVYRMTEPLQSDTYRIFMSGT